jgi:hypothetical protein
VTDELSDLNAKTKYFEKEVKIKVRFLYHLIKKNRKFPQAFYTKLRCGRHYFIDEKLAQHDGLPR